MPPAGAPPAPPRPPRRVSTLLGHAHVGMALGCLGSLLRYADEPLGPRAHDDGTLTGEDRARLAAGLAGRAGSRGLELVPRAEADERMAPLLARHPAARAFRSEHPLGLKLLDVPFLANTGGEEGDDELAYCDSDVLFLRPFADLFELPPSAGALFMSDVQNAYSLRSWHLLRDRRLRLPARVNTGILAFRPRLYDLDLVERYLATPAHRFAPVWVEQTAWALLGWKAGCRLLDPEAVAVAAAGAPTPSRVALHFVSPVRHLLPVCLAAAPDRRGEPPVAVRSLPAARCGVSALAATEARRFGRRLLARR